ncbi:MAG TPA: diaminopimelate decarboxylase [Pararhizobium sp.]|uniref:diaminopimelate decarboxylase n=1 Tax=Pararhizobium sp. TaxID=1977563 RepID=UPI002C0D25C9|nr:diaminopimelate decarboxylase [Pararhizobium sp.]HTO34329.1 diaminopimelate decarboxylase [Pararhizobium sp.]
MPKDLLRPHVEHFVYQKGELHVEDVSVREVARDVGTPFYIYSASAIRARVKLLVDAMASLDVQICYAMKANSNLSLLRILAGLGCGVDLVSGGELERAQAAGFPGARMVFSGVGKTHEEIVAALDAGVHQLNVESVEELVAIDEIAGALGKVATVVLRINPDVDAGTHPKITTGTRGNKFGISYQQAPEVYALASRLSHINLVGLAVHIGSQITDVTPFRKSFERVADLVKVLRAEGLTVERLDLGGGLGVAYSPEPRFDVDAYANAIRETLGDCGCALTMEPGRFIVAEAGALVTKVLYNKEADGETFTIVDAGMNDLMRPALYGATHPAWRIKEPTEQESAVPCHLVGPVCESSDTFGRFTSLPPLEKSDFVALGVAGAYGSTMSSTYNARPLVQEVLVEGNNYFLIRRKQTVADLLQYERVNTEGSI